MNTIPYGFRIVGPCTGDRRLVTAHDAFNAYAWCDERARVDEEAYLSAFDFGEDFRAHLTATGTTKAFDGVCCASLLWWDIDRANALDVALRDTRTLCMKMCQMFAIDEDALLVFYSGSKGFHIGLPTALWLSVQDASVDFHRIARRFCQSVAENAGVIIDSGVYDKVRAFRAPNSRHAKTGRHKRWLSMKELLHLDADAIIALAQTPQAVNLPQPTSCDFHLAAEWETAKRAVRAEAEAIAQKKAVVGAEGTQSLNRQTVEFMRNGAQEGDRHRLLYSAARNLGEFCCPPALAYALLTECALDSGLAPSEVRRQIDCGLNDTMRSGIV